MYGTVKEKQNSILAAHVKFDGDGRHEGIHPNPTNPLDLPLRIDIIHDELLLCFYYCSPFYFFFYIYFLI